MALSNSYSVPFLVLSCATITNFWAFQMTTKPRILKFGTFAILQAAFNENNKALMFIQLFIFIKTLTQIIFGVAPHFQ